MKLAFKLCLFAAATALVSSLPALADEASSQIRLHPQHGYRSHGNSKRLDDPFLYASPQGVEEYPDRALHHTEKQHAWLTYSPTIPGSNEICSNLFTIRVNDTGETCLPGEFTPFEPAPKG